MVNVWNLTSRDEIWHTQAHENIVKDMAWTKEKKLLTCASDKTIKLWDPYSATSHTAPTLTHYGQTAFTAVSVHRSLPNFAASSNVISVFDLSRTSTIPMQVLNWPTTTVSINQTETSIMASCATNRDIVLYDLRTSSPLSKATLSLASNAISWNPMEAFNFCVANEDHNLYMFDMRKMNRALNVFKVWFPSPYVLAPLVARALRKPTHKH